MSILRAAALAALFLIPAEGRAGDAATAEILGFSADGGIFAFEEYGVQDGSGFPYANRYYIDTANDSFLPGTPVRVRLEQDGASLAEARAQARNKAQTIIDDAILVENRGFTAGWNTVTERSADPFRLEVDPRPVFPAIDAPLEFRLTELPMPDAAQCHGLGEAAGFRLVRAAIAPGAQADLLHEDSSIPTSRGCPLGYRLAGVQTLYPAEGAPVFAVIIAIRALGFEGPDHRYIAVTGRF
ncbi:DUF2259 domain-containing protein [Nitratireductor sp. ZSWI3]|nr:DUF2259 domain-containing protein [Nitratireductor sp. ZSWI3]MCR4266264.1 DUF2259 domain-containing protein [Nitratireductor sp. ZSWI3]